jgi:transposase
MIFDYLRAVSKEEIIAQKEQENAALRTENQSHKQEILALRHELDWLKNQLFGQKRERFVPENPDQLALELGLAQQGEPIPAQTEQISYERKKPQAKPTGRQPWPAQLERVEIRLDPPEDLDSLVAIGEDRTELLDYQEAKLLVRVLIRTRYVRQKDYEQVEPYLDQIEQLEAHLREGERIAQIQSTPIIQAPMPPRPLPKASVATGLLVAIICNKYLDHLPLYRQGKRFERLGVKIPRSTLSNWVMSVGQLLMPLFEAHRAEIFRTSYLMIDETTIRVLDPIKVRTKDRKKKRPPPKGKSHRGYFWVYYDPISQSALFDYHPGRGEEFPYQSLQDFSGIIQTDGYSVYEALQRHLPQIERAACLAHARRKFKEALKNDPRNAQEALFLIQQLYAIERQAREQKLNYKQRLDLRLEKAQPIWDAFQSWIKENALDPAILPKSPIGKAINYTAKRLPYLAKYLTDGKLEIDNNLVENAIRPIALGRKNYLFAGSEQAAQYAGLFYSLLATCKALDIDPATYLLDVIETIPNHPINQIEQLLPKNWKPNPDLPDWIKATPDSR